MATKHTNGTNGTNPPHGMDPMKRGRGRPPKGTAAIDTVDLPSKGKAGPPWDHGDRRPDGQPWWTHPLFPIDRTDPETLARQYKEDLKCAKFGGDAYPEVLTFLRWNSETASWIEDPKVHDLSSYKSVFDFVKKHGGGRFTLCGWTYVPASSGDGRKLVMTRQRKVDYDDIDDDGELDQEEEEEEEGEEEDDEPTGSTRIELARLELRRMELQFRHEQQRYQTERAEQESRRQEEQRRLESYYATERQRDREHQTRMLELATARPKVDESSLEGRIMGALVPKITKGALEAFSGGTEEVGALAKVAIKGLERLTEVGGNVLMPLAMAKAAQWGLGEDVLKEWAKEPAFSDDDDETPDEGSNGAG